MGLRRSPALLLAAALLAACETAAPAGPGPPVAGTSALPSPSPPPTVRVAFVSAEGADELVAPAFQGAELAITSASATGTLAVGVELVRIDAGSDQAAAGKAAAAIAADPSVVAAVVAPYTESQAVLATGLTEAGVPVLSLSAVGPTPSGPGPSGFRHLVVSTEQVAGAIAEYVKGQLRRSDHACLLWEDVPGWQTMLPAVLRALAGSPSLVASAGDAADPEDVARSIAASGCRAVAWTGWAETAAAIRRAMADEGLRNVAFIGGDALKAGPYIEEAGRAAEGTVAACPCVDLSTSTDLAAQRFIQDYQAEYGLPPGAYAVEAWDAVRLLLQGLREGGPSRADVFTYLSGVRSFAGLAGTYVFGLGGEQAAEVHLYRAEGNRWVEIHSG